MKTTKQQLQRSVDLLNELTEGRYALDYAYGGVRLVRGVGNSGAQADVGPRGTKGQVYDQVRVAIEVILQSRLVLEG